MRRPIYDMVFACTLGKRGIGMNGKLPWRISKDMKFFKDLTTKGQFQNSVIMGRTTFEQMKKPLSKRLNIVVSQKSKITPSQTVIQAKSLEQALNIAQERNPKGRSFVIGGSRLYQQGKDNCRYLFQTRITEQISCDRFLSKNIFFPPLLSQKHSNKITFILTSVNFTTLEQFLKDNVEVQIKFAKHQQFQYTEMIEQIIKQGQDKTDRTKVGTIGLFGNIAKYDLSESFPLLTTKKVFWKGVVQQLLWFIKGSTNNKLLQNKKVHIWDGNGSKQYLNSIGLENREEGDLGPIYGFQWRHWGAQYNDMHTDYQKTGIDQLNWIINEIKVNPSSRRLIMSAWNPSQLKQMALPPCHVMCQFYVSQGKLNCAMYQRSCDFGLGVPFNIASYSLLTCIVAKLCNLQRGVFTHMMGDTHIYKNHVQVCKKQIDLTPFPFPSLQISDNVTSIDNIKIEDIILKNYKSHAKLEMQMAV